MTDHLREQVWLGFIGSSGIYLLVNLERAELGYSGQICVRSNIRRRRDCEFATHRQEEYRHVIGRIEVGENQSKVVLAPIEV